MQTPLKAIRAKCLDCMCNNRAEVRRCPCEGCALWPFRMGRRPKQGSYTPERADSEILWKNTGVESGEAQKQNPLERAERTDKR